MLSAAQMPKSVEEAEELIRSTFGEMAHRSKVKEIAATLCLGFLFGGFGADDLRIFWSL